MTNAVDHPQHYNRHPSGVECIDVVEHMPFNIGNAIKYLWRADEKGNAIEDLEKAQWYVEREIERRSGEVDRDGQYTLPRFSDEACGYCGSMTFRLHCSEAAWQCIGCDTVYSLGSK